MTPIAVRRATEADADVCALVLAQAFAGDPLWGWAYPMARAQPQRVAPVWALWVRGALANGSLWVTEDCEAVSVWVPPGAAELSAADELRWVSLTEALLGPRAPDVLGSMDAFATAHPSSPAHWYLSLLGTADAHRGHGVGMALMAAVLERVDADGCAAYLESTNPAANDRRYAGVGFEHHGEFAVEAAGVIVNTMWRPARGPIGEQ